MKTPEEWAKIWDATFEKVFATVPHTLEGLDSDQIRQASFNHVKQIQLDALTQGRKEGREQGIRESAEACEQRHERYAKYAKLGAIYLASGSIGCSDSVLALLNHPSPKEQEK